MATNSGQPRVAWGITLFVLIVGAFMSILDTSIVNIAIPKLESVFSVTTDQVQWVVTIYLLALGVVVPASSYLGDRFGYHRVYIFSLVLFTIGSALSGLSWNLTALIVFRVIQAIGGGLIMPVTMAMIYRIVPRDRIGTAMGFWGLALIVAPAIGPTLGGYLVEYVNWRYIFYVNVPIGIIGVVLALRYVPPFPVIHRGDFDLPGFLMVAAGLFGLLLVFSEGQSWGWTSEASILVLMASLWALVWFVVWELGQAHPLLDLRVFQYDSFTVANLLTVIITIGMYSGIFYVPLFLQTVAGFGALKTGLIMMPAALASALMMPISGRLYDRIGARPLALVGLSLLAMTTYLLHNLTINTPIPTIILWLVLRGFGMGMSMMPITTGGMSAVPGHEVGSASAVNNILQRVGGSFGLAVMTALLTNRQAVHAEAMAATITPTANGYAVWNQVHALFAPLGFGVVPTTQLTTTELYGLVQEQSFVLAMGDIFVVAALVTAVGVFVALFLKTYRTHNGERAMSMGD
ncbi:MAG: DHA2 family efflux MFS transporter permease subunit [Sulfobacillus sp.]|nr:DHA2 family efflux MFS transporter permease subunit [Sulfobacillus sp.]